MTGPKKKVSKPSGEMRKPAPKKETSAKLVKKFANTDKTDGGVGGKPKD